MPTIGPFELLAILLIALLILGPSRLPKLANALGTSIREFRTAASEPQSATRLERVAAHVDDLALLGVGKDLVGRRDLAEALLRRLVGVDVGVKLARELIRRAAGRRKRPPRAARSAG